MRSDSESSVTRYESAELQSVFMFVDYFRTRGPGRRSERGPENRSPALWPWRRQTDDREALGELMISRTASAKPVASSSWVVSSAGTTRPQRSFTITPGPPSSVHTTGRPCAMASRTAVPPESRRLGKRNSQQCGSDLPRALRNAADPFDNLGKLQLLGQLREP